MRVECEVHFCTGQRSRRKLKRGQPPPAIQAARVPRISRLMALAIKFDQLLRDGVVADQAELAELARLGHVSRARLTQIMNLLYLAPDIQEQLLFLAPPPSGRSPLTEPQLRPIATEMNWQEQRQLWRELQATN